MGNKGKDKLGIGSIITLWKMTSNEYSNRNLRNQGMDELASPGLG